MKTYSDKLKDVRWQKKRLEILQRDGFSCQACHLDAGITLHVHHRYYEKGKEPWDYTDHVLVSLCEDCHREEELKKEEAVQAIYRAFADQGLLNCEIILIAEFIKELKVEGLSLYEVPAVIEWLFYDKEKPITIIIEGYRKMMANRDEHIEPIPL